MITDDKKSHYLAVTNLSLLLQGNLSNHEGDFYCLNYQLYITKNKLKEHEEICNNHNSFHIEIPKWVEKILKYNPEEKSLKAPFAIYLDLECLLKQKHSCQNNPEKSYTEKKARHQSSGWTMFTGCSFDKKENKINYYRGQDFIEKLCKKLINKSYEEQEACHICEERFCMDKHDKNYLKKRLNIIVITQENLEELLTVGSKRHSIIIHDASHDYTHLLY